MIRSSSSSTGLIHPVAVSAEAKQTNYPFAAEISNASGRFSPSVCRAWSQPGHGKPTAAQEAVCQVGYALGGRPGSRLLNGLGIVSSDDTVLRRVNARARRRSEPKVRVVGVDDWAWRKHQEYGTMLMGGPDPFPKVRRPVPVALTNDWNVDVGPIGVGSGNFPAKYSFTGGVSTTDIAVFNTSEPGSGTAATVIGINDLYVTTPTVAFAYNTTTGDTVATSAVFSFAGDQIAFISANTSHAYLNVLRFETVSGNGTAYGGPVSPRHGLHHRSCVHDVQGSVWKLPPAVGVREY